MSGKADEQVYEVETLLARRIQGGRVEYLVKWKGWGAKWNSWEPSDNILDRNLIIKFEKEHGAVPLTKNGKRRGRPPKAFSLEKSPASPASESSRRKSIADPSPPKPVLRRRETAVITPVRRVEKKIATPKVSDRNYPVRGTEKSQVDAVRVTVDMQQINPSCFHLPETQEKRNAIHSAVIELEQYHSWDQVKTEAQASYYLPQRIDIHSSFYIAQKEVPYGDCCYSAPKMSLFEPMYHHPPKELHGTWQTTFSPEFWFGTGIDQVLTVAALQEVKPEDVQIPHDSGDYLQI